jgi:hypothetical protein
MIPLCPEVDTPADGCILASAFLLWRFPPFYHSSYAFLH